LLLNFVTTFRPDDEIFAKDYQLPARAHKLLEMKRVDMNERFNEQRTSSRRKFLGELFFMQITRKRTF
jgi:hypothetical protein